jgi:hypothetical protein
MLAPATTTMSVIRGTTTDEFGDVIDDNSVAVSSGNPVQLTEIARNVFDQVTGTPKIVRTITALAGSNLDVVQTDRLRDEKTGAIYAINDITAAQRIGYTPDLRLDLEKTN